MSLKKKPVVTETEQKYKTKKEFIIAVIKKKPKDKFLTKNQELYYKMLKEKEIVIDILPWKVVVKGDKVDIGCKKDKSLQSLKDTVFNGFSSMVGQKQFYGLDVHFGKNGFLVEGEMISWETWEKFVDELKKLDVK